MTPEFKVGDKVQKWIYTVQETDDLAAGVVIGVNPDLFRSVNVLWDNLNGDFLDRWEHPSDIELRDWETKREEKARLHNPKTLIATSIMLYGDRMFPVAHISIRRSFEGAEEKERLYSTRDPRTFDRLLAVLNGPNYERIAEVGVILSQPQMRFIRKEGRP